jgi:hypothetical protein
MSGHSHINNAGAGFLRVALFFLSFPQSITVPNKKNAAMFHVLRNNTTLKLQRSLGFAMRHHEELRLSQKPFL